jgi:phosphatidylserine/phosphatidylglycerophosphate/cardiolipin synthase-like enzyme
MNLIEDSEESIRITSPFIKEDICKEILNHVRHDVCFELITDLPNAYTGALDLSGLELIIGKKGLVKSDPKLHSKIYIFDSKKAVITSGNLTNGGLLKNYEYGVLLDEFEIVSKIEMTLLKYQKVQRL